MDSKIISFAIEAHEKANHKYDNKPYSVHLAMAAHYATLYIDCIPEQEQEDVLNAVWLHDTIEDCRLTYNDIKTIAGEKVAEIVYAVSNDKGRNRKERAGENYYAGIRKTPWAKYVKICDRLANVRYSRDTNSKMLSVYKKEHEDFKRMLFKDTDEVHYKDIMKELNSLIYGD